MISQTCRQTYICQALSHPSPLRKMSMHDGIWSGGLPFKVEFGLPCFPTEDLEGDAETCIIYVPPGPSELLGGVLGTPLVRWISWGLGDFFGSRAPRIPWVSFGSQGSQTFHGQGMATVVIVFSFHSCPWPIVSENTHTSKFYLPRISYLSPLNLGYKCSSFVWVGYMLLIREPRSTGYIYAPICNN